MSFILVGSETKIKLGRVDLKSAAPCTKGQALFKSGKKHGANRLKLPLLSFIKGV